MDLGSNPPQNLGVRVAECDQEITIRDTDHHVAWQLARPSRQHIGQQEVYQRVEASVRKTLAEGKGLTRDLGGDGTTATITERLVANLPA